MVFTVENLDEMVDALDCEEIRADWFGTRFAFRKDSDGQPIELKERVIKSLSCNTDGAWAQVYKKQFGYDSSFS